MENISFESFKKVLGYEDQIQNDDNKKLNYIVCNNGMYPKLGKYNKTYCDMCKCVSEIEDGKCIGVFTQGAHYRIAETHPNFNIEKQYEKDKEITTIPYYEIELGVTQALVDDKKVDYKTNYISVEDFNK